MAHETVTLTEYFTDTAEMLARASDPRPPAVKLCSSPPQDLIAELSADLINNAFERYIKSKYFDDNSISYEDGLLSVLDEQHQHLGMAPARSVIQRDGDAKAIERRFAPKPVMGES